jgi:hypothetical protein
MRPAASPSSAISRPLPIIARKKLVGQRVTLENQIWGLVVVFGVRLPRALTAALIDRPSKPAKEWQVSPPPCGD